jgi:FKBP-type peptidyl-prolyl cis-trans isomerase FkpA
MNKIIKSVASVITLSIPILIGSCINTDLPHRTAATEEQEINEAIAKLEKAGYNVDTTELGVYYVMNKFGTGPFPQKSDTCFLIYTGFFLNGAVFDASIDHYKDSIWQFQYREVGLISGLNDAIAVLNKGADADVIIPSSLAYGAAGNLVILPYTPIVFSTEMRDLKPKKK